LTGAAHLSTVGIVSLRCYRLPRIVSEGRIAWRVPPAKGDTLKMKMKNLVLVAAAVCFVAANASAALVDVETTADTWIQWKKPDSVKGTNDYIKVGQSDSNNCGKAYTKWEAPADLVSVKSISFYYAGGGASGRTVALKLLARIDGTDNNWDETTTCWANAPFNDVGTRAETGHSMRVVSSRFRPRLSAPSRRDLRRTCGLHTSSPRPKATRSCSIGRANMRAITC
jgi:hypothetical protein